MQLSDKPDFLATLIGLAAIKPGGKLPKEAYEIWWQSMQGWSLEEFKQACTHLARSVEFMPSPFHFEQLRKAGRPTAGESWAVALACARRGGRTSGYDLIDRAVQAVGGYSAIGMSEVDKTHFLEKRFCEHFETLQDAQDTRESVPQVAYQPSTRRQLSGPAKVGGLLPGVGEA